HMGKRLTLETETENRRREEIFARGQNYRRSFPVALFLLTFYEVVVFLPNHAANFSRISLRRYRQKFRATPCRTSSPGSALSSASIAVKNWPIIILAAPSTMRWPTLASGPPICTSPA